ncbi:DUF1931 domain-containing protein [Haladaptatus caseinilyticus]|uniref:DUF1931 domain-containing protein n=1 Tax=Haladaptatus caseinilyticus TaxID=2993314 RepID=UPI00224B200E|nr:DUF1931 domain-containing protein [Haladaptatus caseinilyticus]
MAKLIVKAAVKELLEGHNVSNDPHDAFDKEVATVIENTARGTEENDRKTAQAHDL